MISVKNYFRMERYFSLKLPNFVISDLFIYMYLSLSKLRIKHKNKKENDWVTS